jgi:F-type H+-transporting ATPase subunit b
MPILFALLQEHGAAGAGAEEAAGASGLLSPHGGLMFWTLLIFIVLWLILSKFAFKPITAAVEAREKALQDAIETATRNREESERLLAEQRAAIEGARSGARSEAQRFIAEGRAAGDRMRTDMLAETRVQQQELLDRARREIEGEKNSAIAELRREAIDLAIAGASKVIEKNLDDESNRRIVENFLASVAIDTKDKH